MPMLGGGEKNEVKKEIEKKKTMAAGTLKKAECNIAGGKCASLQAKKSKKKKRKKKTASLRERKRKQPLKKGNREAFFIKKETKNKRRKKSCSKEISRSKEHVK